MQAPRVLSCDTILIPMGCSWHRLFSSLHRERTVRGPRLHTDVVGLFWKAVSQRLQREHGDVIGEDEPNLIFLL